MYMYMYMYIHMYMYKYMYMYMYAYICSFIYSFIYSLIYSFIYLFIYHFIYLLSIYVFICLFIYLFIYLLVYLLIDFFLSLSIYISIYLLFLLLNSCRTKSWPILSKSQWTSWNPKALAELHARNCIHKDCDQIRAVYGPLLCWCLLRNCRLACSTYLVRLISNIFQRRYRSWIRWHLFCECDVWKNATICRILSWRTWCLTGLGFQLVHIEYMQCRNGWFCLRSFSFSLSGSILSRGSSSLLLYTFDSAVRKLATGLHRPMQRQIGIRCPATNLQLRRGSASTTLTLHPSVQFLAVVLAKQPKTTHVFHVSCMFQA